MYGEGTGYTQTSFGQCTKIENLTEEAITLQIARMAEIMEVSVDNVFVITKEEYDEVTDDCDEDYDDEDYNE